MKIFKDSYHHLQEELDTKGFVKIQLLDMDAVNELIKLYFDQPNAKNNYFGFHITLDLSSAENINFISNFIRENIESTVDEYLIDYKFISPRFAVKEANQNSLIPPHQDWSFVDETQYQSYNLWIALTPSTLNNGTLGFLPNSHNKLKNIRATPLPIYKVPFDDYAYQLIDELEYIELLPGEALFFNSRIIHASKPNITKDARINIAVEITNKNAELLHYNLSPVDNKVYEFKIEDDFFTRYSNAKLTQMFNQKKIIDDFERIREVSIGEDKIDKEKLLTFYK